MSTHIYIYINIYQNNHLDVYRYFQINLAFLFFFVPDRLSNEFPARSGWMWTCLLQDADDDFITMNNDRCRFNDLAIAVNLQTCFYIFQYILPFLEMSCFFEANFGEHSNSNGFS